MKKRSVIWTDEASVDIHEIAAYIARDNPIAALNVADKIERAGNDLGKMAIGHLGRMDDTYEIGLARLPYIITYTMHQHHNDGENIVILRVIHTARNWTENKWPD